MYVFLRTNTDIIYVILRTKMECKMKRLDDLAMSQVERRLKIIRKAFMQMKVKPGWIRFTRNALGMTLEKLAERAGVSKTTAAQAERGEIEGKVTMETLKKMAAAMECEFVYAFVPKAPLKDIFEREALAKAKKLLKNADTHMQLEDQQVKRSMDERIRLIADRLIKKGDIW